MSAVVCPVCDFQAGVAYELAEEFGGRVAELYAGFERWMGGAQMFDFCTG